MSKQQGKKQGLVPKLRFPKFREMGKWESKALGSVCSSFSGGTPNTSKSEYYGGDIPFIRSAEISKDKTELFLTHEGLANSAAKMVKRGDVLVALYGANSGDVSIAKIDGAINQAILCLKSKISNAFIYQYLSFMKDWIVATYLQGGQGNLSGEIVKSISVCFPSLSEQQKIADCLSTLDERITAQAQKVDALKTHKKGLMQQLFPNVAGASSSSREQDAPATLRSVVPRLRFPEFREDMSVLPLDAVAEFVNEKTSVDQITPAQYISTENLLPDFGGVNRAIKLPSVTSVTRFRFKDILVSNIRPYLKKVWQADICGGVSNDVIVIRPTERVEPNYLAAILRSDFFIDYVMRGAKGVKMPRGEISMIREFPVPYPSPAEQQKIAGCLFSLDDLIILETQKLEALKTHKKGLMQQLFPNVTGASSASIREQDALATLRGTQ